MFIHNFSLRFKPDATHEQIASAIAAIRAFEGQIPGLLSVSAGANISPRSQGFGLGGTIQFTDRAALEAYNDHPAHQALLTTLGPLIADAIEVDYQA